ncbi:MAG: hypothetical protein BWK73_09130 [Thiothrix lacustris]|uniref:Uncharacterized protein n=1 Tax=Thiothrix lacustris TaxID=525917 RepID=A0A1Y1QVM4_9GAMM|nr:MAG: hypothetical protein BWK73_09130 [Thiothrix lacustris]
MSFLTVHLFCTVTVLVVALMGLQVNRDWRITAKIAFIVLVGYGLSVFFPWGDTNLTMWLTGLAVMLQGAAFSMALDELEPTEADKQAFREGEVD